MAVLSADRRLLRRVAVCLCAVAAWPACPALARDYCAERPGINTPPCTVEPGRLSVEVALGDWPHEQSGDTSEDTLILGDIMLRYGIAEHSEFRLGWTAHGQVRTSGTGGDEPDFVSGSGDLKVGVKRNLLSPDGSGLSLAVLPTVTLPTGGPAIGAGDWGAELLLPVSLAVADGVAVMLTPQIGAAVNSGGKGRHLAYGMASGLTIDLTSRLSLSVEGSVSRDFDPAGTHTLTVAGTSVAVALSDDLQFDLGTEIGLNQSAPDRRLYIGIARRF